MIRSETDRDPPFGFWSQFVPCAVDGNNDDKFRSFNYDEACVECFHPRDEHYAAKTHLPPPERSIPCESSSGSS